MKFKEVIDDLKKKLSELAMPEDRRDRLNSALDLSENEEDLNFKVAKDIIEDDNRDNLCISTWTFKHLKSMHFHHSASHSF